MLFAKKGMVATSQPLAAQAGLRILQQGGNAVDAAIAVAASLTVLEPCSNGIGGDAFAIVWFKGKMYGLNSSGPAPKRIRLDELRRQGYTEMPKYGWIPVTVPGAPAAWKALSDRFGKLSLTKVLEPAIQYAEEGYPVSPVVSKYWQKAEQTYRKAANGEEFAPWFETFAPNGRAPRPGELWRSPGHADTLQKIAETGSEAFYRGELAEKIEAFAKQYGGYLRADDLAEFAPEWVEPVSISYRGYEVWELPPNGHGIVALMALNIVKGFSFAERESVDAYHYAIEALKLAYADGFAHIADPSYMKVKVNDLLSEAYAEERRKLIGKEALLPVAGKPKSEGTVYLATADEEGNMVSFIQSNYTGFGSGLVVPGTGISLHNRGNNFTLDPNHVNCLEPGKRPYHTIIPGFLTRQGKPVGPFGVIGGFMQPQAHMQLIMSTVDFHLNPQAALDAPRWRWIEGRKIEVERTVPDWIVQKLSEIGHEIQIGADSAGFGRGQIIWRNDQGVYCGGTEPRTDGAIAGW
jgi:gamma-glutamyltranspeptidase/glutathione hydrolase